MVAAMSTVRLDIADPVTRLTLDEAYVTPPKKVLDRIARDSSTAVRLAAVEALYLAAPEGDRDGRVEAALRSQDRPEVQVALVDLLVALRQRRAAEALRRLLAEGRLAPSVRLQAERRLADL